MIYFTSDLHLGHAGALEFGTRDFADIEEMNRTLIDNINETVGEKDELWILGDFAYKISREEVRLLRKKIKCRHVHLVRGNHDRDYSQDHIFQSVQDYKELKTEYGRVVMFHYPIVEWSGAHYGTVHLHGHIHSDGEYNEQNRTKKYADRMLSHEPKNENLGLRIYDAGVDANSYRPVSIKQIADFFGIEPIKKEVEDDD